MSDAHGRDHVTKIELALDADNNFVAVRTETYANMGAYLSTFASCTPTWLHGTLMAGNYKTPHIYVNVKAVFTNTVPVDAYRGAGRPEATFQLERVIDMAARELRSIRSRCGVRTSSQSSPMPRLWPWNMTPAIIMRRWTS